MHDLAPLVYDLMLMLGCAGIVTLLFQRIHQPVVLGYLVAGIIVGPYTPPHALVNDIPNIQILSQLGVIFLMFALGLEFSFQKLTRVGLSALFTGFTEVIFMIIIGFYAGRLLGWGFYDALFLGAALSISSTTIIIKAIEELNLKTKRFAELIFGVLVVEDLLAILLLVGLSTIVSTDNILSYDMVRAGIRLVLVVGGWFIVGYFLVPSLFRRIAKYVSQETLTIISVGLCISLACLAEYFDYSPALGAFIMGSILAETVLVHRIEESIRPIRDIFAAVFFISVGMLIDPMIIVQNWQLVVIISLVTIFGKLITTALGALLTGQKINTAVRVGFSMAQVGEFSFIIASLGSTLQVTGHKLYPLIVAVSGITTFTTPYLIRFSGRVGNKLEEHAPKRLLFFLDNYNAWIFRSHTAAEKKLVLKKAFTRLIINGIIVGIVFSLVHVHVFPRVMTIEEESWISSTVCLLIALTLSSPFIWGMLFAFKNTENLFDTKHAFNPALFLAWLVTIAEIGLLGIAFFHTFLTIVLFVLIAVVFFILAYRHLEKSYQWFERQLVGNINQAEAANHLYDLAPWDNRLVELTISEYSPFVGRTLADLQIRELYNVNIVVINRGSKAIPAPRGNEYLYYHDKVIVLGNDMQIDAFRGDAETKVGDHHVQHGLYNYKLRSVRLDENSPLLGTSIRNSKVREFVNGMVVGLERSGTRILNPNLDTELQANDLLLIVGEVGKMDKINLI